MRSILSLQQRFEHYRASRKWYRHWCYRSAVAIILREGDTGIEALMIRRAEREGDPWSGHMGFPGGRMDKTDKGGLSTAQRETWEEIGLDKTAYSQCIGRLPDIIASPRKHIRPMVISCFVFSMQGEPEMDLNHEVDEVVWVPLPFLAEYKNRELMQWQRKNKSLELPCYFYQGRRIWGLSLKMLDDLLALIKS